MGQDYWPQPAIWKIADADTTIYLFGTQHSLPKDYDWRSPQLDRIIGEAQLLITERGYSSSTDATAPSLYPPVIDRLSGDDRTLWRGMMATLPEQQVAEYDAMSTWAVTMEIGRSARRRRDPTLEFLGADAKLQAVFRAAGKSVEAIEIGEVIDRRLSALPEDEHRLFLAAQLRNIVRNRTVTERMRSTHQWGRGEVLDELAPARPKQVERLLRVLLDTRNADWADALARRMSKPGRILVAVGAAHFAGSRSLLALLSERGLLPQRISPVGPPRSRAAWIPTPATWEACEAYLFETLPVPPGNE